MGNKKDNMKYDILNIFCTNCNTSMEIQPKYLENKNSLSCINCDIVFPQEALLKLKDWYESYRKSFEYLEEVNKLAKNNKFFVQLLIK